MSTLEGSTNLSRSQNNLKVAEKLSDLDENEDYQAHAVEDDYWSLRQYVEVVSWNHPTTNDFRNTILDAAENGESAVEATTSEYLEEHRE